MELTSTQCRAQELIQRERAQSEPLANVRAVALRAALAWGTEAQSAERREIRKQRKLTISEIIKVQQQRTDDIEMSENENPDRGFADQ